MKAQQGFGLVAAMVLASFAPAARAQQARTAMPGTVNYIEGQVAVDGVALNAQQNGQTTLRPNQVLSTTIGKAEVLLSPGVLVRVGNQSQLRMVSSELVDPVIEVIRGEAIVEADRQGARTDVLQQGASASIQKQGLYRFNADRGNIQVIDGKMAVTKNGQSKKSGRGREIDLGGAKLKTASFDRKKAMDDLYQWSSIRSGYLAQASGYTAQNIYAGSYAPYSGDGWYWDPYFDAWSWMPGYGFFYSPFGYPFYSPAFAMYGGWGWGGYGGYGGYGGRFGRGGFGYGGGRFGGRPAGMMARGGFGGGGFHGGGFGGGGFHGGGGRR